MSIFVSDTAFRPLTHFSLCEQDTDRSGTINFNEFAGESKTLLRVLYAPEALLQGYGNMFESGRWYSSQCRHTPRHRLGIALSDGGCPMNSHFDSDHSGSIEGPELSNALNQFGYNLSPQIVRLVVQKYGESLRLRA